MPDEFDAPVEQATAAPGEKRQTITVYRDGKPIKAFTFEATEGNVCPNCNGTGVVR